MSRSLYNDYLFSVPNLLLIRTVDTDILVRSCKSFEGLNRLNTAICLARSRLSQFATPARSMGRAKAWKGSPVLSSFGS